MEMPHAYSRKQSVEIKVTRAGVASWVPAKVISLTRSGAMVQKADSHVQGREFHIMHKDMRPVSTQVVQRDREEQRVQLGHARKPAPPPPAFNPVIPASMLVALSNNVKEHEPADALPLSVLDEVPDEELPAQDARPYSRRMPVHAPIGKLIRERRKTEDLSLLDLGKLLNLSPAHLGEIELGFRRPTDECLKQFASLMDYSYDLLARLRDVPEILSDSKPQLVAPTPIAALVAAVVPPPVPDRVPMPLPVKSIAPANAPEALDVFFEFCDKVEEVCPRPRSATGKARWRELVKELYQLAKETA